MERLRASWPGTALQELFRWAGWFLMPSISQVHPLLLAVLISSRIYCSLILGLLLHSHKSGPYA